MDTLQEKVPPQASDAEKAVLGSMLIEREAVDRALEWLEEKHFYSDAHRQIFKAILNLYTKGQAADLITISEELRRLKAFDAVGGAKYLSELIGKIQTAAHVEYYAKVVREKAQLRQLITTGTSIVERAFSEAKDVNVLIDDAERAIFDIRQATPGDNFIDSATLAHEVLEQIEVLHKRGSPVTGVPTGFKRLDQLTGGFQKSDLIIIAARPSMGKTAFALNIMAHMACEAKAHAAFFSLEMNAASLFQRLMCAEARANLGEVRRGFFKREVWPDLTSAGARLGEAPFKIYDRPGLSVLEVRAMARRLASKLRSQGKELGCVFVDYLQMLRGTETSRREGRQQEVAEISRQLKNLARDLNIPVVALSQLSRRVEQDRRDGRPQLSDLRESGAIEQDADVVMFIYREYAFKPAAEISEEDRRKAEIIIAKQRNGPTDSLELHYFMEWTRFENPVHEPGETAYEQPAVL